MASPEENGSFFGGSIEECYECGSGFDSTDGHWGRWACTRCGATRNRSGIIELCSDRCLNSFLKRSDWNSGISCGKDIKETCSTCNGNKNVTNSIKCEHELNNTHSYCTHGKSEEHE